MIARRLSPAVASLAAVLLVLGIQPPAALAAPGDGEPVPSVREVLDVAMAEYNDAKGRLDASLARQAKLTEDMKVAELRLTLLGSEVGTVAAAAYRGTRMDIVGAILNSNSPNGLLHAAATVQYVALRDDRELREYTKAKKDYAKQQAQLAEEIKTQQAQLAVMEKRKKDAELALQKAGGGQLSAGVVPGVATAKPSPRNADGSWPKETCSVDDPTTSGCLTPRTLHAYQEARLAGYTWYTSCYRSGGSGEHPKGRACDFSSNKSTFLNSRATGADKVYGDKCAGWFMANANALGVLYIIWYKQIWFPSSGWRSYSGDGTPAGDHYNHVHLSMQ